MKPTILLTAPVLTVSGYGSHSRDILKALWKSDKFNISLSPTTWGHTSMYDKYSPEMEEIIKLAFRNKIASTPGLIHIQVGVPHEFQFYGEYNIGITAGLESTLIPPSWVEPCNRLTCLFVPSNFQKDLFLRAGVSTAIQVMPESVDTSVFNTQPDTEFIIPEDIEEKYLFLATGQWLLNPLGEDRKQIAKLLNFFFTRFSGREDVALILKTSSLNNSSVDREMTKERIVDLLPSGIKRPKVHFVHGNFTDKEMASIYKTKNLKGYITFTSGESWGRGLFEAAACGVPVIAPGWSGYMDYLTQKHSTILDFTLQDVPVSTYHPYFFGPGHRWAVVNEDDAFRKLEDFMVNYEDKKARALEFASIIKDKLSFPTPEKPLIDLLVALTTKRDNESPLKLIKL